MHEVEISPTPEAFADDDNHYDRDARALVTGHNELLDPAAVAASEASKERLRAAFIMARQFPRNEERARQRILSACNRPRFAEKAQYAKPVGGRKIIGPSIRLAEEVIRHWGNLSAETAIVFEDAERRRIAISVIDLETNVRHTREMTIKKTVERKDPRGRTIISQRTNSTNEVTYLVAATEDELLVKEAALVSKAIRNESLRCIPADIVEDALHQVQKTTVGEFTKDPAEARRKMIDSFGAIGVSVGMLEDYLGHKADFITPPEFVELRGVYRSLKDGITDWTKTMEVRREKRHAGEATFVNRNAPQHEQSADPDDDPMRGSKQ